MTFLRWTISGTLWVGLVLAGSAQAFTAPTVKFPTSGQKVVTTPNLQWQAVEGATWYRVWLSQESNGFNVLPCAYGQDAYGCWVRGGVTNLPINPLQNGAYWLWVAAYGAGGSAWSVATPFTVCPRFEDLGKTVLDNKTGLEWEKKTVPGTGSIHDSDRVFTWSTNRVVTGVPDGTVFTTFLAGINAGPCVVAVTAQGMYPPPVADCSFAGHGDWRLPNATELSQIVDCVAYPQTCLPPEFGGAVGSNTTWWSSSYISDTPNACANPGPTITPVSVFSFGSKIFTISCDGGNAVAVRKARRHPEDQEGEGHEGKGDEGKGHEGQDDEGTSQD